MDADTALAVRVILAIGLAWLLTFTFGRRVLRLDLRGAGVVGGVCAGIALGPMVLGEVAPGFYERVAVGGVEVSAMLAERERQWTLDLAALRESGVSEVEVYDATRRAELALSLLRQDMERELWLFHDLPLAIASSLGLVALMLGAMRVRQVSAGGVSIGLGAALIAALAWAVLARRLIGAEIGAAAVIGGVLAGGTVFARGAWRAGFGLAGVVAAAGLMSSGGAIDAAWRAGAAVVTGLVVGHVVNFGPRGERRAAWVAHGLLIPAAAALMVSSCDIRESGTGGLVLVLVAGVLGSDLHYLASYLAQGLLGRGWRRRRPMTAWHGAYAQGFGGTQIVLATLVLAFGLIGAQPELAGVLGLAAGAMAAAGEITRPATHRALAAMRRVTDG